MHKLTLAFSPCPNDTYIFDALVNKKIDTEDLDFTYHLGDVQELNEAAEKQTYDITKLSFFSFLSLAGTYYMLDAGSALGFGTGPLLIAKNRYTLEDLKHKTIAIPGEKTTANMLFSLAMPYPVTKKEMLFSDIENAILKGYVDAGVIIHENRFTYEQKGLVKIADLGELWEKKTSMPVPLGGIAVHKRVSPEIMKRVNNLIFKSIEYANKNANMPTLPEFITCNAQEMSEDVMRKHINLYVNSYSLELGIAGKSAIISMFNKALEAGFISAIPKHIFVTDII